VRITFGFAQPEPGFRNVAHAFEFFLHFGVLGFEYSGVGVWRDFDGRRENHNGSCEGPRQQEMVPGFLEGFSVFDSDVKTTTGAPVRRASITGPGFAI